MKKIEFDELKEVVYKIYGLKNIDENTCLNEGHVLSEDNDKFISILADNYNVNMDNFKYYDYFEEDQFIIITIIKLIISKLGFKRKRKKELKLGHILKVINKGEWFDYEK